MTDLQLLNSALKSCEGNITKLAGKAGVSRQVVQHWFKAKKLPPWRRDAVAAVIANGRG